MTTELQSNLNNQAQVQSSVPSPTASSTPPIDSSVLFQYVGPVPIILAISILIKAVTQLIKVLVPVMMQGKSI